MTLNLGVFINAIINFLIVAWAIFLVIKGMNRVRRAQPPPPVAPPRQETLLEEIRDLLKARV